MPTDTGTDTDTDNYPNFPSSRSLLVIDNDAIRSDLVLELTAVRGAIEDCEGEIARHETLDLPAFRHWMVVHCSDLLNERRLIEEKIWGLRARLSVIQGLTRHGIKHVAAAFFWFQEIEQEQAVIPPYVRRAWEEVIVGPASKPRAHQAKSGHFGAASDDVDDEAFEEWRGGTFDEVSADLTESESGEGEEIPRHKSLYRKIALLLHPDLAGVLTKQELELWYQAQRAYEERDVIALETILARCDRVGTNSLTLSELRAFVQQANLRRTTLRKSIDALAKLPSWRFLSWNPSELSTRLAGVRRELEGVIRGLKNEATMMEDELGKIEQRAERWARRWKQAEKQLMLGI
jgi:hypothetical protein